jgi:hypothetical protein
MSSMQQKQNNTDPQHPTAVVEKKRGKSHFLRKQIETAFRTRNTIHNII